MFNGGTLFKGKVVNVIENGDKFPAYYTDYTEINKVWIRLSELEQIADDNYLNDYETRAGREVIKALKSMSPGFYIRKKK